MKVLILETDANRLRLWLVVYGGKDPTALDFVFVAANG